MNINSFCKGRRCVFYAFCLLLVSTLANASSLKKCSVLSTECSAVAELQTQNQQQIHGVISDSNGLMAGVTVSIKGSIASTVTDENGKFSIAATAGDVLLFSYIGYSSISMTITIANFNGKALNITMKEDATSLKEVVVNAGYYTVKEKERTGSISKITSKDLEKQPVTNVLAAMQGRMAGVDIVQTTGVPGGGFTVRIRGINSLRSSGNEPLYIIDGVPFASESMGDRQTSTTLPTNTSPLATLSPTDIESIEILKDADATAIYGSRGANGVVLITTKRGKTGSTQFSASASTAVGVTTRTLDLMKTPQYLAMREQAYLNDGFTTLPFDAYDVNGMWDKSRYTDWQKELTGGTAEITTLQASVSGGSTQNHFLMGATTTTQSTVFPGDFDYKRGGGHVAFDHQSDDQRFKATFSGSYMVQENDQPANDLTRLSRILAPNAPALYNEDGSLNWEDSTWENPLAALNAEVLSKTTTLTANGTFAYTFPYGITAKANMGITDLHHSESRTDPSTIYDPVYEAGAEYSAVFLSSSMRRSWIVEPQLDWNRKVGSGKLNLLVGTTFQHQVSDRLSQYGSGFTSNSLIYNLSAASFSRTNADDQTVYRYQAVYGRANYTYKDKYILNLTGRRDGSSRFGPGKQFANFGAVGAAWVFSEEKAVRDGLKFLSFGKLRCSYGLTGNDQIGDYQFLDTYQSSTGVYDGTVGLNPTRLFNPNFSWESNRKIEAALELGFLKDRLFLTSSVYRNRSSNQLIGMPLPTTTGFSSIQTNLAATVQNTGFEFTLRAVLFQNPSFAWTTNFNVSVAKNKLLSFPGLATSTYQNQYVIGESVNIQKLYHFTGVNPQTGVYEFEDVNGDGSLSFAEDAQTTKDFSPKYFGGLQNQIRFKRLQLDFLFQFVKQENWNAASVFPIPGVFANQPVSAGGAWEQAGDVVSTQLYSSGINSAAVSAYQRYNRSDAAVSDASYIRLKNISLSYTLPTTLKSLQCKLFFQAQNLFIITPYKDGDPEFTSFNYLPPLRILSFGTEIKF